MKISVNHLGFIPDAPEKRAIIRGDEDFREFELVNLTDMGYNEIGPNTKPNTICYRGKLIPKSCAWGKYRIADFSDFDKPGIYLITLANKYNSVPFHIRPDLYSRSLRKTFDYIHVQRCGDNVSNYHKRCHLDDARRRDTGEYVDTVGGWHDAGDLRKWVEHTLMLGLALAELKRLVDPPWNTFDLREGDVLAELRWGNQFFLKMQAADGQIWQDVGAGVDGDNSDNHWTDNVIGTTDDRHINTAYVAVIQWEFIRFESLMHLLFGKTDQYYAKVCLDAARKTFAYMRTKRNGNPREHAWAILALKELLLAAEDAGVKERLLGEISSLLKFQEKEYRFNQKTVKGFWYYDGSRTAIFKEPRDSAVPLIALCEALPLLERESALRQSCAEAIKDYCQHFVKPMSAASPFGMLPYGLYTEADANSAPGETYRDLDGGLKYRFFPQVKGMFAFGSNSHLLSHAIGLSMASEILSDPALAAIGRHQVEWVMGGNTENSCLMSGEGINNPYPHSRFLGLIPGGIMNGIAGGEDDLPFLDMGNTMDWRTAEYWSPHVCYYIWYVSLISRGMAVDPLPY